MVVLIAVALYLIISTVITVKAGERAVIFSKVSGVLERPRGEGWHVVIPYVWEATMYDVKTQTWTISVGTQQPEEGAQESGALSALTSDGQQVKLDLSVRYHPDPDNVWRVHQRVGPDYLNKVIRPLTRCITRMVIAEYAVTDVYSEARTEIETKIQDELREALATEDIILDGFLVRHVTFSQEFQTAIEAKQEAVQEVERMQYVLQTAEKDRDSRIVEAEGEAEAIRMQGEALKQNPMLIQYEYARKVAPRVEAVITESQSLR
jgi:regulator of protease activity HflC (stomatin/prohibitin superfamily)